MYCCYAFKNLINNAGNSGFAVLVCNSQDKISYALQMRSVAFADVEKISQKPIAEFPKNITLSESMKIRYCPSCGKCLADLHSDNEKEFKKIAAVHKQFQDDWGI